MLVNDYSDRSVTHNPNGRQQRTIQKPPNLTPASSQAVQFERVQSSHLGAVDQLRLQQ
jgi:hypothetical protein